jgi:hypothetical protein
MELALIGSGHRTGNSDRPDQTEPKVYRWRRACCPHAPHVEGRSAGEQRGANQQLELRLQAPGPQRRLQPPGEAPRDIDQHAIENTVALDVAKKRRAFAHQQV